LFPDVPEVPSVPDIPEDPEEPEIPEEPEEPDVPARLPPMIFQLVPSLNACILPLGLSVAVLNPSIKLPLFELIVITPDPEFFIV
jgi:hypothetical protein